MTEIAAGSSNNSQDPGKGDRRGILAGIALFLRQVASELKKVVTPTKRDWFSYTLWVLGFVAVVMVIVSALDFLFGQASIFVFTNQLEQ